MLLLRCSSVLFIAFLSESTKVPRLCAGYGVPAFVRLQIKILIYFVHNVQICVLTLCVKSIPVPIGSYFSTKLFAP